MGRKHIDIHLVKEVIRLRESGLSYREIAQQCGIGKTAAQKYYHLAQEKGLHWDTVKYHPTQKIKQNLQQSEPQSTKFIEPDFKHYAVLLYGRQFKTIDEAYEDYFATIQEHESGYSRSSFFRKFKHWLEQNEINNGSETFLTHNWVSGQCCQIDYSGDKLKLLVEHADGSYETRAVEIFVGVLPYSKYVFCFATKDQTRESWLLAITEMFHFFKGVPKTMLCDNTSSLVTYASRHYPVLPQEVVDFGKHYDISIEAVAPAEPTYKGSVENAVGVIQDKILHRLRKATFHGIDEINSILRREILRLNNLKMRGFGDLSRSELFELESKTLKRLPAVDYQFRKPFKRYKVGKNYCIRIRCHSYSVPYTYVGHYVKARVDRDNMLRIFDIDSLEVIAEHFYWGERKNPNGFSHIDERHRPPHHFSEEKRLKAAQSIINHTTPTIKLFAKNLLGKMPNSSANKKANALFGIHSLKDKYGLNRLNIACARALEINHVDINYIKKLLQEQREMDAPETLDDQELFDFMYEQGFLRDFSSFQSLVNNAWEDKKNVK